MCRNRWNKSNCVRCYKMVEQQMQNTTSQQETSTQLNSKSKKIINMRQNNKIYIFFCLVFFFAALVSAAPKCSSCASAKCACPTPEVPLQSVNPLHGQACTTHGDKQCLGNDFGQCNWGIWDVKTCMEGTRCVPNDFQCVPLADWDRVNEQVNGNNGGGNLNLGSGNSNNNNNNHGGGCEEAAQAESGRGCH